MVAGSELSGPSKKVTWMNKKDYVALAKLVAAFREKLVTGFPADEHAETVLDRDLIVPLAHMLKANNEAFDYARFLAACGVVAT
jgi:hypothetical protein